MSKLITDFGVRAYTTYRQKPGSGQYKHSPDLVDRMIDTLLAEFTEQGFPEGYKVALGNGQVSLDEANKIVSSQIDRIRVNAIELFEGYFSEGADFDKLKSDFQSGNGPARRIIRYMGVFPVEAVNVRAEILFPPLMRLRAANAPGEFGPGTFFYRYDTEMALIEELRGPHFPPMTADALIGHMKEYIPHLDYLARQMMSRGTGDFPNPARN